LIANAEQIVFMRGYGKQKAPKNLSQERWIGFLPLFHAYGQVYTILMAAKLRARVWVMKTFNYERFLWIIQTQKISHLQIAPPIMIMLSKRPETSRYDLSSVQDVLCGAAPLSRALQNEVVRRFGFTVKQGWGMTEVTCGGLNMPGDITSQTGSVGMLHPNSSGKLVDEEGNEVGPGERGELYYKGPNVALGYWRNSNATREAFADDGWLKTGDIAVMDHKGMFWIVDRKKVSPNLFSTLVDLI
jgi:4-coumarate--CoA ligase